MGQKLRLRSAVWGPWHLVSYEDWVLKAHSSDCDSDNSTIGASYGEGDGGEFHFATKASRQNLSMRIGKHGHSDRP